MNLVREKDQTLGACHHPILILDAGRWQTGLIPKRNYTGNCSEFRKILFP